MKKKKYVTIYFIQIHFILWYIIYVFYKLHNTCRLTEQSNVTSKKYQYQLYSSDMKAFIFKSTKIKNRFPHQRIHKVHVYLLDLFT